MPRSRHFALTLIELLVFIACTTSAVIIARWRGYDGWRFVLSGVVGFLLPLVALFLYALLGDLIWSGLPPLPPCHSGKCRRSEDYSFQQFDDGKYGMVCKCGTRYRKQAPRVLQVLPDGSLQPYMKWKPFRGWKPDQSA
jgi:hypothetical protein